MPFQIGDKVVYPNQGVGIVEQISTRNLTGQPEMFYLLRLTSGTMRVIVPISSVVNVGAPGDQDQRDKHHRRLLAEGAE